MCAGIERMVNVLKSVILPLTLVDRHITVEEAVSLSRLEQEYQVSEVTFIWNQVVDCIELLPTTPLR